MASRYIDTTSIMQVIGCVFNNPKILEITDKYSIIDEDFVDPFHRVVFGAIYKIHELGADKVSLESISDFLSSRPKSRGIYEQNKGEEWILRASDVASPLTFDYYYNRMKKFTLLRAYDNCGVDVSDIYDVDNIMDAQKKQLQEDGLDNSNLAQIADKIDAKIEEVRLHFVEENSGEASQAGDGVFELVNKFKENPEVGIPLYGPLINTVTRGARLKKMYLRSAPTGVGNFCRVQE